MSEMPTTTLQVWPTADGKRWRCTCPWHHTPPVIFRDNDQESAGVQAKRHVEAEHGWKVIGVQVLSGVTPGAPKTADNCSTRETP